MNVYTQFKIFYDSIPNKYWYFLAITISVIVLSAIRGLFLELYTKTRIDIYKKIANTIFWIAFTLLAVIIAIILIYLPGIILIYSYPILNKVPFILKIDNWFVKISMFVYTLPLLSYRFCISRIAKKAARLLKSDINKSATIFKIKGETLCKIIIAIISGIVSFLFMDIKDNFYTLAVGVLFLYSVIETIISDIKNDNSENDEEKEEESIKNNFQDLNMEIKNIIEQLKSCQEEIKRLKDLNSKSNQKSKKK